MILRYLSVKESYFFCCSNTSWDGYLGRDGLHPNKRGNALLASCFRRSFKSCISTGKKISLNCVGGAFHLDFSEFPALPSVSSSNGRSALSEPALVMPASGLKQDQHKPTVQISHSTAFSARPVPGPPQVVLGQFIYKTAMPGFHCKQDLARPAFPQKQKLTMATLPFSVPQSAPPPLSVPQSAPPPLSVPQSAPPPLSVPQSAPPPLSVRQSAPPPLSVRQSAPPPLSVRQSAPPPLSVRQSAPPPLSVRQSAPPPLSVRQSAPPPLSVPLSASPLVPLSVSQVAASFNTFVKPKKAESMEVSLNKLQGDRGKNIVTYSIPTSNKYEVLSANSDMLGETNGGGPKNCPYSKKCDSCGKIYSTPSSFSNHLKRSKCLPTIRNSYPRLCELCLKPYDNKCSFWKHLKQCCKSTDNAILTTLAKNCSNLEIDNIHKAESSVKPTMDSETQRETNSDFSNKLMKSKSAKQDKIQYPRLCEICLKSYSSRSSFCNHLKHCSKSKFETSPFFLENSESSLDSNNLSRVESVVTSSVHVETIKNIYPSNIYKTLSTNEKNFSKKCFECGRFYENEKSFKKHEETCCLIKKKELFLCVESNC
ncbi:unnamed protein product, partial [Larinioides sclopetarius]